MLCLLSFYKVLTSPNKAFKMSFHQTYYKIYNQDLSQLVLPWRRWWRQQKYLSYLSSMLWEPPESSSKEETDAAANSRQTMKLPVIAKII